MNTKLTLRLDEELIQRAKKYSRDTGKALSQLVADYFLALTGPDRPAPSSLPPIVRSLRGSLRGQAVDEEDFYRHLEEKHPT